MRTLIATLFVVMLGTIGSTPATGSTIRTRFTNKLLRTAVKKYAEDPTAVVARHGPIGTWDTSAVTSMQGLFEFSDLNEDISGWDTSSVTSMKDMFMDAYKFNGDISSWDTSSVRTMDHMFSSAEVFNGDISAWDTSRVMNMKYMFSFARQFNQDIGGWDVSSVKNMHGMWGMFYEASSFSYCLRDWAPAEDIDMFYGSRVDMSACEALPPPPPPGSGPLTNTHLRSLISAYMNDPTDVEAKYGPIGTWDTSAVTNMSHLFYSDDGLVTEFNGDIGGWDVSNVKDMTYMFADNILFNQDIGAWDVSSVTDMGGMFYSASAFNQDIGGWDVSSVKTWNMQEMFAEAKKFSYCLPWVPAHYDQDLGYEDNLTYNMFGGSGVDMSTCETLANDNPCAFAMDPDECNELEMCYFDESKEQFKFVCKLKKKLKKCNQIHKKKQCNAPQSGCKWSRKKNKCKKARSLRGGDGDGW